MPRYSFGEVPAIIGSAPQGYKVTERARVIGRGDAVFVRAKVAIWTWQIQAGSRFEPLTVPDRAIVGAVSRFRIRFGPLSPTVTCRVFAVIDQEERAGFAHEAIRGHPQSGWESFIVERDGDNVVLRIRVVARPAAWWMRAAGPAGDIALHLLLRRNLRSLDTLLINRAARHTSD
ncbi:MAG TPA: DUF1990 domain-containing protein [Glaciihabitans sp.]|jgi:uncharacterized protein (UPF0548 family)|nr:DUF1990 domain-containing protein [Glaciihabitans sp.]